MTNLQEGGDKFAGGGVTNRTPSLDERSDQVGQNGQTSLAEKGLQNGQNGSTGLGQNAGQTARFQQNINMYTEITSENQDRNHTEILSQRPAEINPNRPEKTAVKVLQQQLLLLEKEFRQVLPEEDPARVEQFVREAVQALPPEQVREAVIEAIKRNMRSLRGVREVLEMWRKNGRNDRARYPEGETGQER